MAVLSDKKDMGRLTKNSIAILTRQKSLMFRKRGNGIFIRPTRVNRIALSLGYPPQSPLPSTPLLKPIYLVQGRETTLKPS